MENTQENEIKHKSGKKKTAIIIVCIIVFVIAAIFYVNSLKYQSTDDAYIESDLIQIAPRVSGQIEEIYIEDNRRINEGDLVAKIDDTDYKIRLEQAQAMYEKALYSQKVAKAKLGAVNSEINFAKKDLERTLTNFYSFCINTTAKDNYRYTTLNSNNGQNGWATIAWDKFYIVPIESATAAEFLSLDFGDSVIISKCPFPVHLHGFRGCLHQLAQFSTSSDNTDN